jgi:predicted membrane chloride channel (bestrophin family)
MFALNFISIELENPFGLDANDLPLPHFQFLGDSPPLRALGQR